jgi:hypothetical protein
LDQEDLQHLAGIRPPRRPGRRALTLSMLVKRWSSLANTLTRSVTLVTLHPGRRGLTRAWSIFKLDQCLTSN